MQSSRKIKLILIAISVIVLNTCAYYNTFYNAEQYFAEAQKLTRENQQEKVSREETRLYSKAIEKSRKLLNKYPESKYTDDAQFLIAKSYYFKGDYNSSKAAFERLALEYSSSPFTEEVPLWVGRCLVQLGDLEMGRHEASRILRENASRTLKADALLMMGEIAVKQDSFELAENYLEEAIETSPDGYTKAKARFELGQIRENQQHYEGALEAYQGVSRYDPSESLKIEAIIRQTSMLKILERNEEAIALIQEMLESDRFVDVRGQLEIELGKLYRSLGESEKAILRLKGVVENYPRKEEAAAANFYLGELYLLDLNDYKSAREAYSDIRKQFSRSPYGDRGVSRLKQIDRYQKLQTEYISLGRQLAGYPPLQVKKANANNRRNRSNAAANRRSRRGLGEEEGGIGEPPAVEEEKPKVVKEEKVDPIAVSAEDSTKFIQGMDDNRYSMAEYMLFEFGRVDTVLEICAELERTSLDSTIMRRAAYMSYYALDVVRGDSIAARGVLERIQRQYPIYYEEITSTEKAPSSDKSFDEEKFQKIAELYENGDLKGASEQYRKLWMDEAASQSTRSRACFNHAWINDHYLFDKESALAAYESILNEFPLSKFQTLAQERYDRLTAELVVVEERDRPDRSREEESDPDKEDKRR